MMIPSIVAGLALVLAQLPTQAPPPPQKESAGPDTELVRKLLSARRVFVESFGDDSASKTLESMVVDAIGGSRRFIVTENKDRADLILKGATLEKTSQEFHSLGSSTSVAGAHGASSSHVSGVFGPNGGTVSGSGHSGAVAQKLGISDDQASTETVDDVRASVRLVSKDGDVVWSTTQESRGAKYKSATADVADKVAKQLMRDLTKLEGSKPPEK